MPKGGPHLSKCGLNSAMEWTWHPWSMQTSHGDQYPLKDYKKQWSLPFSNLLMMIAVCFLGCLRELWEFMPNPRRIAIPQDIHIMRQCEQNINTITRINFQNSSAHKNQGPGNVTSPGRQERATRFCAWPYNWNTVTPRSTAEFRDPTLRPPGSAQSAVLAWPGNTYPTYPSRPIAWWHCDY